MVSIAEAKEQLEQARQQLTSNQQNLAQQRRLLSNPNLLRKAGCGYLLGPAGKKQLYQQRAKIQTSAQQLEQQRKRIVEYEQQIGVAEEQQRKYEEQQREYQDYLTAKSYVDHDQFPFFESKKIRKLYAQLYSSYKARREYTKKLYEMREMGLKPVFVKGEISGFEDIQKGVTYKVSALPEFRSAKDIKRLEEMGVISATEPTRIKITDILPQYIGYPKGYKPPAFTADISGLTVGRLGTEERGTMIIEPEPPVLRPPPPKVQAVVTVPEPPKWFYPKGFPEKGEIEIKKITDIIKLEKYIPDPFPRFYYEKGKYKTKYLTEKAGLAWGYAQFPLGIASGVFARYVEFPSYFYRHRWQTVKGLATLPKEFFAEESLLKEQIRGEFYTRPLYGIGYAVGLFYGGIPGFKSTVETIDITSSAGKIFPEITIKRTPPIFKIPKPAILPKPGQEVPSPTVKKYIETTLKGEPTTRESARVLIKDEFGNYILDASGKESGLVISYGGGLKTGEKPRSAAIREFTKETGGVIDITGLKYKGKQVFAEEIFYVFTKVLTEAEIAKLTDIKRVSPAEWKNVRGQSATHPFEKGGVRIYELALMNWLETNKPPMWLYSETSMGKYYYGIKSRYEITPGGITAYGIDDELALAHGTQRIPVSQFIFKKEFEVKPGKRAEPGLSLYVHPPISPKKIPVDVKRLIGYTGEGEFVFPKEFRELPFKVPKEPAPGYIALNYPLGGAGYTYRLAFGLPLMRRGALLFKEALEKPLRETQKAISGKESELAFEVGTQIKTIGKRQVEYIMGKRFVLQPAEVIKTQTKQLTSDIQTIDISFEEVPTRYITRYDKAVRYKPPSEIIKSEEENLEKATYEITEPAKISVQYESILKPYKPEFPSYRSPYKYELEFLPYRPPYKPEFPPYELEFPPYRPEIPKITPRPPPVIISKPSGRRRRIERRPVPAYTLLIKRRGRFVPVAVGLPRGRALQIGAERVEKELSRQFKIVQSGMTSLKDVMYRPRERAYRAYKIRKGKKIPLPPDTFIQRTSTLLKSAEEKEMIRQARILAIHNDYDYKKQHRNISK